MERKRVIVAFGDIYGFRNWMRRALTTPEESRDLIDDVYSEFDDFILENSVYVKLLGDGILIVKELGQGHSCVIASKLLKRLYRLAARIEVIIKAHYPRPEGFRLRVASGHVWKRHSYIWSRGKKVKRAEYVGYIVNLTHSLLEVMPNVLCVCHESVVSLLGQKRTGIEFERLGISKNRIRGVDTEDLQGLSSFTVVDVPKKGV